MNWWHDWCCRFLLFWLFEKYMYTFLYKLYFTMNLLCLCISWIVLEMIYDTYGINILNWLIYKLTIWTDQISLEHVYLSTYWIDGLAFPSVLYTNQERIFSEILKSCECYVTENVFTVLFCFFIATFLLFLHHRTGFYQGNYSVTL